MQELSRMSYVSMREVVLAPGSSVSLATGDEEMFVLPLSGSAAVACDGETFELSGRPNVFSGPSDTVYLPRDSVAEISSPGGGRFALPAATCSRRLPVRYVARDDVPVEVRGAGTCERRVHNFGAADVFEADRLIAVEVITPGGNWSSYPPHKHDENLPGEESELEEIYYFEIARSGFGFHRVYGTSERPLGGGSGVRRREIDVLREVRTGDVVEVPHGWHGPSAAVPGYDMYYLNAMAGPGQKREWLIRDDPDHAWIRETWE